MSNIARAVVTAHTGAEALFFPFIQKSLEKGSVKKGFKGGSCDFCEAWGRVEGEGWFLSWADWKQQLMTYVHSPPVPVLESEMGITLKVLLSEGGGTPSWDCRDG